jgi:hypothetical protein
VDSSLERGFSLIPNHPDEKKVKRAFDMFLEVNIAVFIPQSKHSLFPSYHTGPFGVFITCELIEEICS